MKTPLTYTNKNETGCCAVPNVEDWNEKEVEFENKRFIRMQTRSIMFVPINMTKVMTAIQKAAIDANAAMPPQEVMILTRDLSPWKAEQLYAVTREVPGVENVVLSGTFLTKVYEGPFKNARQWFEDLQAYAKNKGREVKKTYFYYTTCPKCIKHYGKNYVIGLVEIA